MDARLGSGLVAIAAVVVLALLARGARGGRDAASPAPEAPPEPEAPPDAGAGPEGHPDDVVAVTTDGEALVPDRHAVRLLPAPEPGEEWKESAGLESRVRRGEQAVLRSWHAGDFTGARIVRGEADEGPWRFEALGRDGEYTALVFETREAADAALAMFGARGVVRVGSDDEGRPMPPSPEQFEEARRVFLETEMALEAPDEDEEPRA